MRATAAPIPRLAPVTMTTPLMSSQSPDVAYDWWIMYTGMTLLSAFCGWEKSSWSANRN
jgi:hypothetical protein